LLNRNGTNIGRAPGTTNHLVWWDADLVRELFDGQSSGTGSPRVDKYGTSSDTRLITMTGAGTNNGTKANPSLTADFLGDWREEVIVRSTDNMSLRIYTTIIAATSRLFTLMHDSQYRTAITWQNAGYNQPPHPSFFLGAGMAAPPQPKVFFGGELIGDYNLDGVVDAGDYVVWRRNLGSTSNLQADGDHDGVVGQGDLQTWKSNFGAVAAPGSGSGNAISSFAAPLTSVVAAEATSPIVAELLSPVEIQASATMHVTVTEPSVPTWHRSRRIAVTQLPQSRPHFDAHLLTAATASLPGAGVGKTKALGVSGFSPLERPTWTSFEDVDAAFAALGSKLSSGSYLRRPAQH
jgi:hypothetical protein